MYKVGDLVLFNSMRFKGVGKIMELNVGVHNDEVLIELPKEFHGMGHLGNSFCHGRYCKRNYWYITNGQILKVIETKEVKEEEDMEYRCEHCGVVCDSLEEMVEIDGKFYCDDCVTTCDDCGETVIGEYCIVDYSGNVICESCRDDYVYCDHCEEYYPIDQCVFVDSYDVWLCEDCYYDSFIECEECGEQVPRDDAYYDEENDRYLCEDCWNNSDSAFIKGYHSHTYGKIFGNPNEDTYGFELEVENKHGYISNGEMAKMIDEIFDKGFLNFEHDGSLNDGFEIITSPFTLSYIRENKDKLKLMLQLLIDNGFRSHNTSTCGLHVHYSRSKLLTDTRSQEDVIDNVLFITETFKDNMQKFARRQGNGYCQYYSIGDERINTKNKLKSKKDGASRYYSVNIRNRKTLEFRMFKGTLKFETIMATLEMVNNIINIAKFEEFNKKLTWNRLVNFNSDTNEYILDYCKERDIKGSALKVIIEEDKLITINDYLKKIGEYSLKKAYECLIKRNSCHELIPVIMRQGEYLIRADNQTRSFYIDGTMLELVATRELLFANISSECDDYPTIRLYNIDGIRIGDDFSWHYGMIDIEKTIDVYKKEFKRRGLELPNVEQVVKPDFSDIFSTWSF